jgi:hypothetical protein
MNGWKAAGAALCMTLLGGAARSENRFIPYDIPHAQATWPTALNDDGTVTGTAVPRASSSWTIRRSHPA